MQLCLINTAHEHFITQTVKKSKTTLKNVMGPGGRGPTNGVEGRGPSKTNTRHKMAKRGKLLTYNEVIQNVLESEDEYDEPNSTDESSEKELTL